VTTQASQAGNTDSTERPERPVQGEGTKLRIKVMRSDAFYVLQNDNNIFEEPVVVLERLKEGELLTDKSITLYS